MDVYSSQLEGTWISPFTILTLFPYLRNRMNYNIHIVGLPRGVNVYKVVHQMPITW